MNCLYNFVPQCEQRLVQSRNNKNYVALQFGCSKESAQRLVGRGPHSSLLM